MAKSRSVHTHPGKLLVLSRLLEKLFEVKLEELIPGIETKLGSRLWGLRGSADLIFSNVVFEIKVDLKRELGDAERQLSKYFQALLEREPKRKHIGVATDCISFIAYTPKIKNKQVVGLNKTGSLNISRALPSEGVLWLDSFIFSKPRIVPSAMDLRWRFGPESQTYFVASEILGSLWDKVWNERDVTLKLDLWCKNMEIVYGSRPKVASFIDHTYLVTLVKLIVFLRLSGGEFFKEEDLRKVLTGEYFASYGIANLIEEDFFAWVLHPDITDDILRLVHRITKELMRYDLSQIDEDFFKEIYQEIVKRSDRHRIGEYYTPEWLVESILNEVLELFFARNERAPRILDPACGSGTFLCNVIRILTRDFLRKGKQPTEILDYILQNVVGVDINPLAVVIARANYVLALGDLLKVGKRKIIPIYVADSIKPPKVTRTIMGKGKIKIYEHSVQIPNKGRANSYRVQIPESVLSNETIFSKVLDGFKSSISSYCLRRDGKESLGVFSKSVPRLSEDELLILRGTLSTIFKLIHEGNDAIWAFMLSNIYAPVTLMKTKFDIVCGNPPWIAMRYVENKNYQDFLKDEVLSYGLLESDQVHLFTHMEMATLFFCRTADLYLDDDCLLAFVMPRSVLTGALHHAKFKQFKKPKVRLTEIFDLEEVSPLLNVPSCVLIAVEGEATSYPVIVKKYSGELDEKNLRFSKAMQQISISEHSYRPPLISTGLSWYHYKMREGATLTPRSLWFVDFVVHEELGIDVSRPLAKTSKVVSSRAKDPWKGLELTGNVEAEFIYSTLLGGDIVPFGFSTIRSVVLPVESTINGYSLVDVNVLRRKGLVNTADWLEEAQELWEKRRTVKAKSRFPRVLDRLDYNGLLSCQNPRKRYVLLHNASGTNLTSCVVDRKAIPAFSIAKSKITPNGFVADAKTWFYETNLKKEAHYLCAVLNSNVINMAIKPLQTRGLWGERDIHRRPFMIKIPKFKKESGKHLELAELSMKCHSTVANIQLEGKSPGKARREAKESISEKIKRIDELTLQLLK